MRRKLKLKSNDSSMNVCRAKAENFDCEVIIEASVHIIHVAATSVCRHYDNRSTASLFTLLGVFSRGKL